MEDGRRTARRMAAALLAGLALAGSGCTGDADRETRAAGSAAAADTSWEEADTVNVRLTEYRIQMPRSLPPGPTVFRVTNSGAVEHGFEIEGEGPAGLRESFSGNLNPAATRELKAYLEPGKYKVFCPVDAHARRGGVLVLDVPARSPADPAEE